MMTVGLGALDVIEIDLGVERIGERFGLARGVSNIMTAHSATIDVREGLLVAIHLPSESPLTSTLGEQCGEISD